MRSVTKTILNRETIDKLVRAHFGDDVRVVDANELTDGWFNSIYVLTLYSPITGQSETVLKTGVQKGKYVLTYEKEIMRSEVLIYRMLESTELPAPRVLYSDFTHQLVDFDYFFMEKLRGPSWEKAKELISPENAEKLQYEHGRCTAIVNSVKGNYFGYIKDDPSYHFSTWRNAFRSFIDNIVEDGKRGKIDLPYDEIYTVFEPLWGYLDDVTEPSLVHYDMCMNNIHVVEQDGEYTIDGIIDHERAFYGDPVADLILLTFYYGGIENATAFLDGYASVAEKPIIMDKSAWIRHYMYIAYLAMIGAVEVYRYEGLETNEFSQQSGVMLEHMLNTLRELSK